MNINILHHGGATGVTGSCHELSLGTGAERAGILVDCGLFQGSDAASASLKIDFPIEHIRALVLTHVHIDHVGRLPYLLSAGFSGPIICSKPTALLLPSVLEDALKIGFTRDTRLIKQVLGLIESRLVPLAYNDWHSVWDEPDNALAVRLQRAGHILGSAYVECDVTVGETQERVVFSGDLGASYAPLLPSPVSPERADRLVIETTYGDKLHEDRIQRRYRLRAVLEHALADGGTVLIPAFSIGRTQDILYEFESLIDEFGDELIADDLFWRDLQIVVDSPLAANFTQLYRQLKPYWDDEARALVAQGRHPLLFEQLTLVDSHEQHSRLVNYLAHSRTPAIVLAGSGMCTGGRVVNYLKALLGDVRNDVLFVGYQAEGTPGRDILTYGPRNGWVTLDDERYTIRAQVHQVSGYSAHADQADLLRFIQGIPQPPREIRLVHGEPAAKQAFARCLESAGLGSMGSESLIFTQWSGSQSEILNQ